MTTAVPAATEPELSEAEIHAMPGGVPEPNGPISYCSAPGGRVPYHKFDFRDPSKIFSDLESCQNYVVVNINCHGTIIGTFHAPEFEDYSYAVFQTGGEGTGCLYWMGVINILLRNLFSLNLLYSIYHLLALGGFDSIPTIYKSFHFATSEPNPDLERDLIPNKLLSFSISPSDNDLRNGAGIWVYNPETKSSKDDLLFDNYTFFFSKHYKSSTLCEFTLEQVLNEFPTHLKSKFGNKNYIFVIHSCAGVESGNQSEHNRIMRTASAKTFYAKGKWDKIYNLQNAEYMPMLARIPGINTKHVFTPGNFNNTVIDVNKSNFLSTYPINAANAVLKTSILTEYPVPSKQESESAKMFEKRVRLLLVNLEEKLGLYMTYHDEIKEEIVKIQINAAVNKKPESSTRLHELSEILEHNKRIQDFLMQRKTELTSILISAQMASAAENSGARAGGGSASSTRRKKARRMRKTRKVSK